MSPRWSRSWMKAWGIIRENYRRGSACELCLDARGDLGHIGATCELRFQRAHDLPHVRRSFGAGLRDGRCDRSADFLFGERRRHVTLQYRNFELLVFREIVSPALFE